MYKVQDNPYMKKVLKSVEKIGHLYEEAKSDEEKKVLSDNIIKTEAEIDSCKGLISSKSIYEKKGKKLLRSSIKGTF